MAEIEEDAAVLQVFDDDGEVLGAPVVRASSRGGRGRRGEACGGLCVAFGGVFQPGDGVPDLTSMAMR